MPGTAIAHCLGLAQGLQAVTGAYEPDIGVHAIYLFCLFYMGKFLGHMG